MTSNELHAWRGDTHVGVFIDTGDGVTLHYDSDTVSPLSLSLPTNGEFSSKAPARWLDGLLPERERDREALARKHGCTNEPFDLLQQVGADVGGAISLLRAEESPSDGVATAVTVTDEMIALMITQQSRDLPPSNPGFGGRMSLAGYQAKFSLARTADGWQTPTAVIPSTHIFKPPLVDHPNIHRLEAATLELARRCGLAAARARVVAFGGQECFVTTRFDRTLASGSVERVHMEDCAQAIGRDRKHKYDVTARDIVDLLRRQAPDQVMRFVEQLAFNVHVGNADAHAKNYSILLDGQSPRLAPLYDSLPLQLFSQYQQNLAMHIGNASVTDAVTNTLWQQWAKRCNLDPDEVTATVSRIANGIQERAPAVYGQQGIPRPDIHRIMRASKNIIAPGSRVTITPPWHRNDGISL